jgi:hypothetical protein
MACPYCGEDIDECECAEDDEEVAWGADELGEEEDYDYE